MAQYYVHNLRQGGSPAPAGYSSWLDYWERRQAYQLEFAIGLSVIKPLLMARMYKLLMAAMSGISYHFVIAATRSLELIFM